jgi:hypothetical protein
MSGEGEGPQGGRDRRQRSGDEGQHLGNDTAAQYTNSAGRPIAVLPSGKAIEELC